MERFLDCVEKDRIGSLPQHLIGSILERLPVQDAVRTSILSRSWRYRWTMMTVLAFDRHFSTKYTNKGGFGYNGFVGIINHVLILHNGPISKFSLHIPRIYLDSFREVDQTMLLISRKNIQELVLTNSHRCYELPPYVTSCSKLRDLKLENCIFKPLLKFEVFSNLEHLHLKIIDFEANSCGAPVTLPQLRRLVLVKCKNVYNFNIKASRLQTLLVYGCHDAMLLRLLDTPHLNLACLYFVIPVKDFVRVERMNLARLLSKLPKMRELAMDGHFMKFLSADKIPKWLPCAVDSLIHLRLESFQLSDLDQLRGALCLLRNSPNLERLCMKQTLIVSKECQSLREPRGTGDDVGPASYHLESSDCLDQTLNRLRTVEIESFGGSRPELLYIKLLLAHSPSLLKLTIQPTSDAHKRLDKISMDVMRFPRASPEVKVIFLNPNP